VTIDITDYTGNCPPLAPKTAAGRARCRQPPLVQAKFVPLASLPMTIEASKASLIADIYVPVKRGARPSSAYVVARDRSASMLEVGQHTPDHGRQEGGLLVLVEAFHRLEPVQIAVDTNDHRLTGARRAAFALKRGQHHVRSPLNRSESAGCSPLTASLKRRELAYAAGTVSASCSPLSGGVADSNRPPSTLPLHSAPLRLRQPLAAIRPPPQIVAIASTGKRLRPGCVSHPSFSLFALGALAARS